MTDHSRWFRGLPSSPFLAAPAGMYFVIQYAWRRVHELEWKRSFKAPIPVISIGNIAMGGTGKTPFVMYVTELLVERGWRPCVVSRGYKGSYTTDYIIVKDVGSSGPKVNAALVGDEPFLIASGVDQKAAVMVGRDRLQCVTYAAEHMGCDVAVLDDGFQHLRLKRDLDIVLLSGQEDHMFPLGILREPFSALSRADVIVVDQNHEIVCPSIQIFLSHRERFRFKSVPLSLNGADSSRSMVPESLRNEKVLLVSGIAGPERFIKMAQSLEWSITDHLVYRDHHNFASRDLDRIVNAAKGAWIVFTEKDWVKLRPEFQARRDVLFLRIRIQLENDEIFINRILKALPTHGTES
jgi:tetraacyldisaccharide 4'-kinase